MAQRGSLRASDQDREQVVERLRKAATEGRLVAEELELRVTSALKARTYDELNATIADLPAPTTGRGRRAQRPSTGRWVVSTVSHNPMLLLFAVPVIAVTAAMLIAATVMWMVLMIVVLLVGGRGRIGPPPWMGGRRMLAPRRGGPGRSWGYY